MANLRSQRDHLLQSASRSMRKALFGPRGYGLDINGSEESLKLTNREAKLLRVEPGTPVLRAVRRYFDERQNLLELSDAIHPGDRFTYVTKLRRE